MLVFRNGKWHMIDVLFSDPMLTMGHKAAAAAMIANGISIPIAEKRMYEEILGISREQHNSPENKEK
jgi:hypothetical protein